MDKDKTESLFWSIFDQYKILFNEISDNRDNLEITKQRLDKIAIRTELLKDEILRKYN